MVQVRRELLRKEAAVQEGTRLAEKCAQLEAKMLEMRVRGGGLQTLGLICSISLEFRHISEFQKTKIKYQHWTIEVDKELIN